MLFICFCDRMPFKHPILNFYRTFNAIILNCDKWSCICSASTCKLLRLNGYGLMLCNYLFFFLPKIKFWVWFYKYLYGIYINLVICYFKHVHFELHFFLFCSLPKTGINSDYTPNQTFTNWFDYMGSWIHVSMNICTIWNILLFVLGFTSVYEFHRKIQILNLLLNIFWYITFCFSFL